MTMLVEFYKMQGSGNDFILIPNFQDQISAKQMSNWAKTLCQRCFAIGADGLIFLEQPPEINSVDFQWHFFNANGSRPEMCGNGARCAAKLAYIIGLAGKSQVFATDAGKIKARILPEINQVKVELTTPMDLSTNINLQITFGKAKHKLTIHYVNTGVPHSVVFCQKADHEEIKTLGPAIRYHENFSPLGTNLNIVQVLDKSHIYVRTYERGVEAETFACGTGAAASAYIACILEYCTSPVNVRTSGGEELKIFLVNGKIFLQGGADLIYKGSFDADIFNLYK